MKENNIVVQMWEAFKHVVNLMVGTAFLALFVGALFAPAFEVFLNKEFRLKMMGAGCANVEEIIAARRQLTFIRLWLWIVALAAWTFLIVANVVYRGIC